MFTVYKKYFINSSTKFSDLFYSLAMSKVEEKQVQDGVTIMDGWENEPANMEYVVAVVGTIN